MLFHVIWQEIFQRLEAAGQSSAARALQRQYFVSKRTDAAESAWDAPWRSGPDRIMPGTDAGSALQEAWHGHVFGPAFVGVSRKDPWTVAKVLQDAIVTPLVRQLCGMQKEGKQYQDWPGIGQFVDPLVFEVRGPLGLRRGN